MPMQRLTRTQFLNSARDLLQLPTLPELNLAPDETVGPFAANAQQAVADLHISQYAAAAETLAAAAAAAQFRGLLPCPVDQLDAACVRQFAATFGRRAFRRPLTDADLALLIAAAQAQTQSGDFRGALTQIIAVALQAPDFLYRVEVGDGSGAALTPYELATRLSYALWDTTPDAALLAAASAGQLDAAGLAVQLKRMVADPRFGRNGAHFVRQLLAITDLASQTKDPQLFPAYSPALAQAMAQETDDFAAYVLQQGDARLSTLLTADFSILNDNMFVFYGLVKPVDWTPGTPVALTDAPGPRGGLLTQASFLATHAHANTTNAVARGKLIRENLLCTRMPAPPANIPPLPPATPGAKTARMIFAAHEANTSCAGCHRLMDSFGLAFEHFDATGAWRATDGGLAIDTGGTFISRGSAAAAFTDPQSLAALLVSSPDVQKCAVLQTFRFLLQRQETPADACFLTQLQDSFGRSHQDLRALMLEILSSPAYGQIAPSPVSTSATPPGVN